MQAFNSFYRIDGSERRHIALRDRRFYLIFPHNPALLPHVRRLPDRHFDATAKAWWVPARPSTATPLRAFAVMFGFDLSAVEPALAELVRVREQKLRRSRERFLLRDWSAVHFPPEAEDRALQAFNARQRRDHFLLKRCGSQQEGAS